MVALTAVLGPKDPAPAPLPDGTPVGLRAGWDVFVSAAPDAASAGTSLGTFEHNSATDVHYTLNHAVVDHIRGLLYAREAKSPYGTTPPAQAVPPAAMYSGPAPGSMWPYNITSLADIRIKRYGPIMTSTAITAVPIVIAVAGTGTIAPKLQPGDVASAVADSIFVSNNPAVATVSAAGLVTGVAPGSTQIKITHRSNGLVGECQVTVTGTTLLFRTGSNEAETKIDKDGKKTYVPYDEPEAKKAAPKPDLGGPEQAQGFVVDSSEKAEQDTTPADTKARKAKEKEEEEDDDDNNKKKSKK